MGSMECGVCVCEHMYDNALGGVCGPRNKKCFYLEGVPRTRVDTTCKCTDVPPSPHKRRKTQGCTWAQTVHRTRQHGCGARVGSAHRSPNRSDASVSVASPSCGDTLMTTQHLELPPRAFRNSSVSLEAR